MNVEMQHRFNSDETFRQIFKWEKIDVCKFSNDLDSFTSAIFKKYLLWANQTFQGVFHKCPYRELIVENLTLSLSSYEVDSFVPNGEIGMKVHLFNNRDHNIGTLKLLWKQNYIDV